MGAEVAKAAVVYARHLSGAPFRVLVAMALSTLDKPKDGKPASLYFAGWEPLALVLGYDDCDRHSPGEQAVKRAISTLRKEGHITPLGTARIGTRQTYLIHPGGLRAGQKVTGGAGQKVTGKSRSESDPGAGHQMYGLGPIEEQGQDLLQDTHSISQPSPKTARDDKSAKDEGVVERWKDERCEHGHLVRNDTCATCAEWRHVSATNTERPILRLIEGETA